MNSEKDDYTVLRYTIHFYSRFLIYLPRALVVWGKCNLVKLLHWLMSYPSLKTAFLHRFYVWHVQVRNMIVVIRMANFYKGANLSNFHCESNHTIWYLSKIVGIYLKKPTIAEHWVSFILANNTYRKVNALENEMLIYLYINIPGPNLLPWKSFLLLKFHPVCRFLSGNFLFCFLFDKYVSAIHYLSIISF